MTDGCNNEYTPLRSCQGVNSSPLSNTFAGICIFHRLLLKWRKDVKKYFSTRNEKLMRQTAVSDVFLTWIKSWAYDLETEYEYRYSKIALNCWFDDVSQKYLDKDQINALNRFLIDIQTDEMYWVSCYRSQVFGLGERTTSGNESIHNSYKHGSMKISANYSMKNSVKSLIRHSDMLCSKKKIRDQKKNIYEPLSLNHELMKHLTKPSALMVLQHLCYFHSKKDKLIIKKQSSEEYYIHYQQNDEKGDVINGDNEENIFSDIDSFMSQGGVYIEKTSIRSLCKLVIPKYNRVRTVRKIFDRDRKRYVLKCTCMWSNQMMLPCCHIIALTGSVDSSMCHIRWHCCLPQHFGKDEHYTKEAMKEINAFPCGIPILPEQMKIFDSLPNGCYRQSIRDNNRDLLRDTNCANFREKYREDRSLLVCDDKTISGLLAKMNSSNPPLSSGYYISADFRGNIIGMSQSESIESSSSLFVRNFENLISSSKHCSTNDERVAVVNAFTDETWELMKDASELGNEGIIMAKNLLQEHMSQIRDKMRDIVLKQRKHDFDVEVEKLNNSEFLDINIERHKHQK